MLHYQHILLTTDFSEKCAAVANQAKELVENSGATLSIVHVIEFSPMMYSGGEFAIPVDATLEETLVEQAKADLSKEGQRLGVSDANQFIVSGSAKDEIVKLAQERNVDLIVVGGHDAKGIELLFGSTANSLLHAMPCDLLAVKLPE